MSLSSETGIAKYFRFAENGTNLRTEIIAGLTTFMTMAYIMVVNPAILEDAFRSSMGGDGNYFGAIMIATILSTAVTTILMGLYAKYPFALAPGMGLNAYFAFVVATNPDITAGTVLGAVMISGIVFFVLSLIGARQAIVAAIPTVIKRAIPVGIGLFIAVIGLKGSGLVQVIDGNLILGDLAVNKGQMTSPVLTIVGLAIISILLVRKVKGAIFIGIIITALIGAIPYFGQTSLPSGSWFGVPAWGDWTSLVFGKLDVLGALNLGLFTVIFAFLFVDMFDTIGTLIGVADQGGFLNEKGELERIDQAMQVDAFGTMLGSVFGTSTVTSYIESAAGVAAGGRTGLTAIVVGICFLLALVFQPILSIIPGAATYPALVVVGILMMKGIGRIKWDDFLEAIPAFLAIVVMPLTSSIANGIAVAFISYSLLMIATGQAKKVHWLVYLLSVLFICRFIFIQGL